MRSISQNNGDQRQNHTDHLLLENLGELFIHGIGHSRLALVPVQALEAVLDVLQEGKRHTPSKFLVRHAQEDKSILRNVMEQEAGDREKFTEKLKGSQKDSESTERNAGKEKEEIRII